MKMKCKKILLFGMPLIINVCLSVISLLGRFEIWWFGEGLSGTILFISNSVLIPLYMLIILHKLWDEKIGKNILNFISSYFILKIAILYDLLNWYILGGAMDSAFRLIYGTEWFLNSTVLILGWIIMAISKCIRSKTTAM